MFDPESYGYGNEGGFGGFLLGQAMGNNAAPSAAERQLYGGLEAALLAGRGGVVGQVFRESCDPYQCEGRGKVLPEAKRLSWPDGTLRWNLCLLKTTGLVSQTVHPLHGSHKWLRPLTPLDV